jgi:hypothetical protein
MLSGILFVIAGAGLLSGLSSLYMMRQLRKGPAWPAPKPGPIPIDPPQPPPEKL